MNKQHTLEDRFWIKRFLERNQAVLGFQKARFVEKERDDMSEEDIQRYFEALTMHLQKSHHSSSRMRTKCDLESQSSSMPRASLCPQQRRPERCRPP
jgi:hypothetical protein